MPIVNGKSQPSFISDSITLYNLNHGYVLEIYSLCEPPSFPVYVQRIRGKVKTNVFQFQEKNNEIALLSRISCDSEEIPLETNAKLQL